MKKSFMFTTVASIVVLFCMFYLIKMNLKKELYSKVVETPVVITPIIPTLTVEQQYYLDIIMLLEDKIQYMTKLKPILGGPRWFLSQIQFFPGENILQAGMDEGHIVGFAIIEYSKNGNEFKFVIKEERENNAWRVRDIELIYGRKIKDVINYKSGKTWKQVGEDVFEWSYLKSTKEEQ